jgi:hypothetical protein
MQISRVIANLPSLLNRSLLDLRGGNNGHFDIGEDEDKFFVLRKADNSSIILME